MAMAAASSAEPSASCEAPLKPNQPSQRIKVPRVASGKLAPGIGWTLPLGPYLPLRGPRRSEEHTSELQSLMRNSYAVFCLKKKQVHHEREEMNIVRLKEYSKLCTT